jgi:LDH2 family malate/lactate/ureidoglycolate dehydrogenase
MKPSLYKEFLGALTKHGLTKIQAGIVLEEYGETQDLSALPSLLERLKLRKGAVKTISSQGAIVYLEGNRELGQIAADKAVKLAITKAKQYGIGMVGLRNILSFSHPGTYAEKLAANNLFGLVMIDGGRAMVTHPDSPEPVIGTNPIAFGMPTSQGPWVVDMATSKNAWAKVRKALEKNSKLPAATYKTKAGKFTQNSKEAFSVTPFGDYKGFALGMLVEILCGGMFDMAMGKNKKPKNYLLAFKGAVFIAIDLGRFTSISKFKNKTSKFIKEVKSSRRNAGVKKIRIPGESSLSHARN